ncbi:pyridoxal phosphate-dependent aminotransferase [Acidobacteriota bacterium]
MAKLKMSRRTFMGSLAASAAVLPLRSPLWPSPAKPAGRAQKKINWGYPEGAARLNSNENPLGPSPRAVAAMEEALSHAHRYCSIGSLIRELASYHGVSNDMILAGCGSTEFLRIAPWTFLRQGGELITALQTFKTLGREGERIGAEVRWIPLNKEFLHDLKAMKNAISPETKLINIVNPNNPTGTCFSLQEIKEFCTSIPKDIVVFIDEAYSHFLDDKEGIDGIELVKENFNVVVARTFSKVHGMAGIRLGYVVAKPSLIKQLRVFAFRMMGINQAAYAGGLASLEDEKHVQKYKHLIQEGMEFYYEQFESLGLEYIPSKTPFLMVKVNAASKVIRKKLIDKNVYIRKGEDWNMPEYLRISIGLQEENKACVEALKKVLSL